MGHFTYWSYSRPVSLTSRPDRSDRRFLLCSIIVGNTRWFPQLAGRTRLLVFACLRLRDDVVSGGDITLRGGTGISAAENGQRTDRVLYRDHGSARRGGPCGESAPRLSAQSQDQNLGQRGFARWRERQSGWGCENGGGAGRVDPRVPIPINRIHRRPPDGGRFHFRVDNFSFFNSGNIMYYTCSTDWISST